MERCECSERCERSERRERWDHAKLPDVSESRPSETLAPTPAPAATGAAGAPGVAAAWDELADDFVAGYFEANPTFAAFAGRHEHDGRLPDWSREGLEGEGRRLSAWRRRALAVAAGDLDPARRRDRELLLAQVDGDLFWREEAAWPARNPLFYAAALDPSLYVSRDYAPLAVRAAAFARFARAVPRAVAQIHANLAAPLPATYLDLGASTFAGLARFCGSEVPSIFAATADPAGGALAPGGAAACDPALLAEVHDAGAAAAAALAGLGAWFESARLAVPAAGEAGLGGDFRLGATGLTRMLAATERIGVPLAAVEAAGRRDLERNLAALAEACGRLAASGGGAPGADPASIAACMARVQARKPADGPVAAARRQLGGLRRFVEERGLVSIPGAEEARVEEAPPHQRWNSAYIEIPGPYDRHLPAIYYIAPPDPAWSPAERAAYLPGEADLLFISAHEVWPGHFLQFLHSNRAPSELSRLFVTYAFAEGWAHYGEEMIWEAGFGAGDAEIHVGQLQNALLRTVRLLAAIGLHSGEMSLAEAEAMFRGQAFQDPASARQQAARGTFDPGYLNYTLGKMIIRRLRQDWLAAAPGRDWRGFHDSLLSFGGPPLPLVRAAMLPGAEDPLL
jgi:hypothetical protein